VENAIEETSVRDKNCGREESAESSFRTLRKSQMRED
jgi:hypothetical protein